MVDLIKDVVVYSRYRATNGTEFRLEIRDCKRGANYLVAVTGERERNHGGRIGMSRALENAAFWAKEYEGSPTFRAMGFERV